MQNPTHIIASRGSLGLTGRAIAAIFLAGMLTAGPAARAQSDTGRVTGTVTDSTGAVIPNASITLTNTDTGKIETKTSGPDGAFAFPAEMRGNYSVETAASGFNKQVQKFTLQVQQVQTIEFKLAPGGASTTVEVTDAAPVVDLSTSDTGEVIEGKQIVDLPINGHNFTQLALLTPGVTRGGSGGSASGQRGDVETFRYNNSGGAALAVNGLRQQANNFLLDGVDNNESLVNTIVLFAPPEAVEEFRVTTSVAPAEFGRAGGAIVNTSIKSGTNQIHGSGYVQYRSDAFDASPNYFSPTSPKPNFQRKQFAATLGGPIWKDRVFLFVDYQGQRQNRPQDTGFYTVPTALERTGNFSELLGLATTTLPDRTLTGCQTVTTVSGRSYATTSAGQTAFNASTDNGAIFDPTTCAQFGTAAAPNVIPASRANSAGLKYLQAYPGTTRTGVLNNYYSVRKAVQNYDDGDARLDWHISQRDSVFARFSYAQDNLLINSLFPNLPAGFASGANVNRPRGAALGYTRLIGANLVNEFRFGYTRPKFAYLNPQEGTPVSANLGIQNANRNALLGGGALIGGNNSELQYTGDGGPYTVPEHTYQYADSLTWTRGVHTLKFGANFIQREVDFFQGNNAKGYFVLGGVNYPGTGRFTGYEMSEVLSGFSDYQVGSAAQYFKTHNIEDGFFAQDDWKVSRRLTLNLGVRYDLYTSPYEENNNQANYDIASGTLKIANQNGNSRSLIATDKNNIAPRIGFAYDLFGNGHSSLRGGFGIFYFLDRGGVGNQLSNNPGYNGVFSYTAANGYRITFTGQAPQGSNNSSATQSPLPLPSFGPSAALAANPTGVNLIAELPSNQNSSVNEWNLQFQQQLDRYSSFHIAYVGTKSDHLLTWFNLNSPIVNGTGGGLYPNRNTITEGCACGVSHYNGLQLAATRTSPKGLTATLAYTWSHTLDNSNGAFATGTGGAGSRVFITSAGPNLRANYGNSDQDQRNVFVASLLYQLPFGRGQRFGNNINHAFDLIAGGWQVNSITTLADGNPIDFDSGNPQGGSFDNRPDFLSYTPASKHLLGGSSFANNLTYFNATMGIPPVNSSGAYARIGTLSRNRFYGPGYADTDVSAFKGFHITERVNAEFRAQAFNVFNHPQFGNPDTYVPNGISKGNTYSTGPGHSFGTISSTRSDSERQIELGARVQF